MRSHKVALLLVFFFLPQSNNCQTKVAANLSGVWLSDDDKQPHLLINQYGAEVIATLLSVNTGGKEAGFKVGDVQFKGVISDHIIHSEWNLHYPLSMKQTCGDRWQIRQPIDLHLSQDNNIITGTQWHPIVYQKNCKEQSAVPESLEFIRDTSIGNDRPTRIRVDVPQPSAALRDLIKVKVGLASDSNRPVLADRDYEVSLHSNSGEITPNPVSLPQGSYETEADLKTTHAGFVTVEATQSLPLGFAVDPSEKGTLKRGTTIVAKCDDGEPTKLEIVRGQEQELAAYEHPITFSVVLVNNNSVPVTDGHAKLITFDHKGVGKRLPINEDVDAIDGYVMGGGCVSRQSVVSERAGVATIIASTSFEQTGEQRIEEKFSFYMPWSVPLCFLIVLGSAGGSYVRANRSDVRRKPATYIEGIVAGFVLFFLYYYGLLAVAPRLTAGNEVGLLLGIIGGYSAKSVLNLAKKIILARRETAQAATGGR